MSWLQWVCVLMIVSQAVWINMPSRRRWFTLILIPQKLIRTLKQQYRCGAIVRKLCLCLHHWCSRKYIRSGCRSFMITWQRTIGLYRSWNEPGWWCDVNGRSNQRTEWSYKRWYYYSNRCGPAPNGSLSLCKKMNHSKSNITSGGLGTMGYALPASIGAAYGDPNRTVVAVIGDGGFQMTIQELGTIIQYKPKVKLLILNNNFLGMVRQWQQLFHEKRYSFVDIQNPDFYAWVAKGYHINGQSINDRSKLRAALQTMLDYDGTYLLESDGR